jgi:two-component system nitrogen regulation response regulator GlnG
MIDSEHTLTSPLSVASRNDVPLLAMTIAWHPDPARIGEQFIWADGSAALELSRFMPLFRKPGGEGLGLGHPGISRAPLRMVPDHDGVTIHSSDSRMVSSLNGLELRHPTRLAHEQVSAGAILSLGRVVLLCLHWVRCLPKHNPVDGWLGVSSAAIKTRDLIRQVARTDATVLLLGETGTGKDVAARAIHGLSRRAEAPLVSVNMAALNESLAAADLFGATKGAYTGAQVSREGLFGQAQGATLFLDEVGNTPAAVQPMLLRALETGEYRRVGATTDSRSDARLLAATDQDLYGGAFNQALLRRLESFVIQIPPLRARREDIGVLIVHILQYSGLGGRQIQLPVSLVAKLLAYDWPGNVRQLAHVVKRALLALDAGETPDFETLVDSQRDAAPPPASSTLDTAPPARAPARARLHELREENVLAAMEQSAWCIQRAAQVLGISRPSMYKLLAAHSQIRSAGRIPADEIARAFAACGGDVEDCASLLKTPTEGLRRELRVLNLTHDPAGPAPAFQH